MAKEISIMYSINVFFEKKFQVDDDFVLNNRCGLKEAFEEIAERFPEKDLLDLDDTNCDCSSEYHPRLRRTCGTSGTCCSRGT